MTTSTPSIKSSTAFVEPSATIPFARAWAIANFLRGKLEPCCAIVEIAGSVRRGVREVGDIELICMPVAGRNSLFGDGDGPSLDQVLHDLQDKGQIFRGDKWGDKWKKLLLPGEPPVKVDLFIVPPEEASTWGMQFAVRTGPADLSRDLVTPISNGGHLPLGWKVADGWKLFDHTGQVIPTPTERDVFEALGMKYIEPEKRQ